MTIQESFDDFLAHAYKDPPRELDTASGDQYRQLRDAFFGGCAVGLGTEFGKRSREATVELFQYLEAKGMNLDFASMTEYKCECCREVFLKTRPDAQAEAEFEANFGELPAEIREDRAIVCDDCFHKIMAWNAANPPL